jgi:16S rRNA (cytidine1402-2'-O)-methyltransferase
LNPGTLYLIPTPLGEGPLEWVLPAGVSQLASRLEIFIVEHPKTARQFLKQIGTAIPLQSIQMNILDEHTKAEDIADLLKPILEGKDVGLISEAGCPAVADPGSELVRQAHALQIPVVPLVGPSSIMLALMASGLNGQRFRFVGYLPTEKNARIERIRELEKESIKQDETEIFIETPYRNDVLMADLLQACSSDTLLSVAMDLTVPGQSVRTQSIEHWRKNIPELGKRPAVFLLYWKHTGNKALKGSRRRT